MMEQISYEITELKYYERSGNLKAQASGVVKSEKYFPYYILKNEERIIFKPLSKTKPLTTPIFAYAEVFWSYVINQYFMPAPLYQLAICHGYETEQPKYYDYGTVVPSICKEGEQLVNLLEFFREHPDAQVNIDDYENYCMIFYDYTDIFESEFLQSRKDLGEELAMHVLVSILKGDQNYHYENVAFLCNRQGEVLCLAPMIDHEFSTMFLFPDDMGSYVDCYMELIHSIEGSGQTLPKQLRDEKQQKMVEASSRNLHWNIQYILKHYPKVVDKFIEGLEKFERELDNISLQDFGYLFPCNSWSYAIGKARYKDFDEEKAKELEQNMKYTEIDIDFVEKRVKKTIKKIIDVLKEEIMIPK